MGGVNYKTLYLDFLEDTVFLKREVKIGLKEKLMRQANDKMHFRFLTVLNKVIKENYTAPIAKGRYPALNTYNVEDIKYILAYQKEYNLTNTAISNHFELSKTTLALWRKIY